MAFADVEASDVGPDGWPVEVGVARLVDGQVVSEGHAIRPEPEWDMGCRFEEGADVHGIVPERFRGKGRPAEEVA